MTIAYWLLRLDSLVDAMGETAIFNEEMCSQIAWKNIFEHFYLNIFTWNVVEKLLSTLLTEILAKRRSSKDFDRNSRF